MEPQATEVKSDTTLTVPKSEVEVDAESLRDAMTSDGWASSLPSPALPETVPLPPSPESDVADESSEQVAANLPEEATPRLAHDTSLAERIEQQAANSSSATSEAPPEEQAPPVPFPEFLSTPVYLAQVSQPLHTAKHRVYHATVRISRYLHSAAY